MNIQSMLQKQFAIALAPLSAKAAEHARLVRPAQQAAFGDYQANFAMAMAKEVGKPPRAVAEAAVANLPDRALFAKVEVAGPGFINLTLSDGFLAAQVAKRLSDARLGLPAPESPRTLVIDYSSPNVAKPMHVGHLRSTVIGDSLARIHRALGWKVVADNHLGDWGTQFGMIIHGWKNFRDEAAYQADPVKELARLYRLVNRQIKDGKAADPKDETVAEAARLETARIHAGEPENLGLWKSFMPHCLAMLQRVYDRLGIVFNVTLGESFYHPMMPAVLADLETKGLAQPSEGALCMFFPDPAGTADAAGKIKQLLPPWLVRKRDGAFTYATSDMACVRYRMNTFAPDLVLYVVDGRQSLHFQQLFAAAAKWNPPGLEKSKLFHVSFGTVLGLDHKPLTTRDTSDLMGLEGLLDEAVERARAVVDSVQAATPEADQLSEAERASVAWAVGHGAVKYADLCQARTTDYVFDLDKMVALDGNTAPYLQMAYARNRSIFRKAGIDPAKLVAARRPVSLEHPSERALAVALLRFPEALEQAAEDYRPNLLANYLYEVSTVYSAFFRDCRVVNAPTEALRDSRLLLCELTARTLAFGLDLLGIDVVERM